MNWGVKIVVSFVLFASFVFTLVFKMITSGNDLVSKDYYRSGEQVNTEIKLGEKSLEIRNGFSLEVGEGASQSITLQFRNQKDKPVGKVVLTCLSSEKGDQSTELDMQFVDSSWKHTIILKHFMPGNWLCEIRGKAGEKDFVLKDAFRLYKAIPIP
jgi:hypothetical protein